MDQRQLIQHGKSSLTVSLPSKWAFEHGLKKGGSVFVKAEGSKLILSTEQSVELGKITVDVSPLDRTSIILYIQSLYRFGYDEIEVLFEKPTTHHHRTGSKVRVSAVISKIANRCIGLEVVDQSENRAVLKTITKEDGEDFQVVLRRAFRLVNEGAESLLLGIKNQDMGLVESIEEYHDNINKLVNYCLRLLNKYGYPDVKKTSMYFHVIASLDKIVDVLKYNARAVLSYKKGFHKDTLLAWEGVNKSIKTFYDLFYNFDMASVDALSKNRDTVKNMVDKSAEKIPARELIFLTNMKQILELLLDLTEFRMGLEY